MHVSNPRRRLIKQRCTRDCEEMQHFCYIDIRLSDTISRQSHNTVPSILRRIRILLYRHRFGKVPWLIYITSASHRNVIGKELERNDRQ